MSLHLNISFMINKGPKCQSEFNNSEFDAVTLPENCLKSRPFLHWCFLCAPTAAPRSWYDDVCGASINSEENGGYRFSQYVEQLFWMSTSVYLCTCRECSVALLSVVEGSKVGLSEQISLSIIGSKTLKIKVKGGGWVITVHF